jgi:phosphate transport system substrate-binding protein
MKKYRQIVEMAIALVLGFSPLSRLAAETTLNGAGATFPYPIYSKWFDEYHKKNPQVQVNYQSIGSGGGIRQFTAKTVDFGATDGPMTDKQLFNVDGKALHIPTVLGAVVPIYNLPGVTDLKLTGPVLADIYLGKIKSWSDSRIKELNQAAALPDGPIMVVRRADGSGTTYCFVDYLSSVSSEWKSKVGKGTSVNWPVGLGGKGNEGVAGTVKQTQNSIGYVELIYAKQNNLSFAAMQNKAGNFIVADIETVSAAAAAAAKNMPKDYRVSIVNADGEKAYPISTFTWLLVYQNNAGGKGQVIKDLLAWTMTDGQTIAPQLGYAPLPQNVKEMVSQTISTIR